MRNFSRTTLIGHVGSIIDFKQLENGKTVINFSIAFNHRGKNDKQNRTEWHKCSLWGKDAVYLSKNLKQGDCLLVEGEYRSKAKVEGVSFCEMYLSVSYVQFLTKKDRQETNEKEFENKEEKE